MTQSKHNSFTNISLSLVFSFAIFSYLCNNSEIKFSSQGKRMDRGWITWSISPRAEIFTFACSSVKRHWSRVWCHNNIDNIQRKSLIRRTSHKRELSRTLAHARSLSFSWHDSYTRDRIFIWSSRKQQSARVDKNPSARFLRKILVVKSWFYAVDILIFARNLLEF